MPWNYTTLSELTSADFWRLAADTVTEAATFWPQHLVLGRERLQAIVQSMQRLAKANRPPAIHAALQNPDAGAFAAEGRVPSTDPLWYMVATKETYDAQGMTVMRCIRSVVRAVDGMPSPNETVTKYPPVPPIHIAQVAMGIPVDPPMELLDALEDLERLRELY